MAKKSGPQQRGIIETITHRLKWVVFLTAIAAVLADVLFAWAQSSALTPWQEYAGRTYLLAVKNMEGFR